MLNFHILSLLITIFFAFNLPTIGQQIGIKVSGGLSKITITSDEFDVPFSTPFAASGQAGLYCHLSRGKHSSLGAELLFSQIEGKDVIDSDFSDTDWITGENETITGHVTNKGYRHISYISLPLYYGYTIKKFTLHAGFQLSYAFSSSGREKTYGTYNEGGQETNVNNDTKTDNINIKKLDFGPRAGITYQLTNRLGLEGTYYYGLNNIQKVDDPFWILKVQQMTLGVRYALWTK